MDRLLSGRAKPSRNQVEECPSPFLLQSGLHIRYLLSEPFSIAGSDVCVRLHRHRHAIGITLCATSPG